MALHIRLAEPVNSRGHVTKFHLLFSNAFEASLPPPGPDSNFPLPFVFVQGVQYGKARENSALVGSGV